MEHFALESTDDLLFGDVLDFATTPVAPLPINQALNRSRTKLGLDLGTWLVIVFISITVFLAGFRMLAMLTFPMLLGGAWLPIRKHPKMVQLWGLSLSQKSHYDPRKQ